MFEDKEVIEIIISSRKRAGLSQRKLAKLSGISNTELSKIEKKERSLPSPKILKKICRNLDIYFNDIMFMIGMGDSSCYLNPFLIDYYSKLTGEELDAALLFLKLDIERNNKFIKMLKERKKTEYFSISEMTLLQDTINDLECKNKSDNEIIKILEKKIKFRERFDYARKRL